jgi:hypothetical protein
MPEKDPLDEFMALPRDSQLATLQQLPAPTQDKILGLVKTRIAGLSANPKGHGIYAMEDETGNQRGVSFDKVDEAGKYGYKFSDKITVPNAKGREDYAKDRFAALQPPKNAPSIGTRGNLLEDRFFKGGKVVPQTPIPAQVEGEPGAWQGLREAMQKAAVPTNTQRPVSLGKTNSLLDSAWNIGANIVDKVGNTLGVAGNTVFGMADMIPQITSASKDVLSYDPYRATTGFAKLLQMMLPVMAKNYVNHLKEVKKNNPQDLDSDVIGTVIGIWASGKLAEKGAKAVSDPVGTLKSIKDAPKNISRATVEAITNTQPRNVKAVGEEALGKALEHKEDTLGELGKRSDAHDAEVKKVKEHNDRVAEKHKVASKKIQMERDAAEHALELRRSEEAKLDAAAQEKDQKYADAETEANRDNDAAWDKVRSKTAGYSKDISQLQKTTEIAAEQADPATSALFKRIIKGEQPTLPSLTRASRAIRYVDSAGNPVDPMTMGAPTLEAKVKSGEYKVEHVTETINPDDPGYGELYEKQFGEPPPVGGGPAQFARLQRWYSYIQDKMYGGGWMNDGHLYKAYMIVRDAINDAMQDIATQANATADLDNARKLHTEKMETFSDSPNEPQTVASKSSHELTPEQSNEKARAERLKKVARYDPTILDTAAKIDATQKRLKGMDTEDQLREKLKQPIPPPSLDHPDDAYRLKPEPEPFTGKPVERDEPTGERKHDPKGKTLWAEDALKDKNAPVDYAETKGDKLKAFQKMTKEYGLRRAIYASFTSIPAAVVTALLGHPKVAALEASVGPAVLIGSQVLANLMDKPEVAAWVEKVTPKDVAEFDKLPYEQKALFTQDMRDLADAAAKKGKHVSPALTRFLNKPVVKWGTRAAGGYAGVANANKPSIEEVKKKAEELQNQMHLGGFAPAPTSTPTPTAPPPASGPQSSLRPTHRWNPNTGQIEAA